jgi:hypothetical protein
VFGEFEDYGIDTEEFEEKTMPPIDEYKPIVQPTTKILNLEEECKNIN